MADRERAGDAGLQPDRAIRSAAGERDALNALVTLPEIRAAAERIRGVAVYTPIVFASGLGLKCENFQPMGAFKFRGALNMLAQLSPEALAVGVITFSSGNHGQALALAAQRLGTRAVVVMPETAPRVKVDGVR